MEPVFGWTDERVDLLRRLWEEGQSASKIAAQLGGVTRNAVIGKVHRLGFAGRVKAVPEAAFEGAEERSITMRTRVGEVTRPGAEYLAAFALPNFYFHLATAYNILRHRGVALGKRDFLGV